MSRPIRDCHVHAHEHVLCDINLSATELPRGAAFLGKPNVHDVRETFATDFGCVPAHRIGLIEFVRIVNPWTVVIDARGFGLQFLINGFDGTAKLHEKVVKVIEAERNRLSARGFFLATTVRAIGPLTRNGWEEIKDVQVLRLGDQDEITLLFVLVLGLLLFFYLVAFALGLLGLALVLGWLLLLLGCHVPCLGK